MRFPKRIKYRGRVLAAIYGKSKSYPFYRLAYQVAGKRRMKSFRTYSEAKTEADGLVRDLTKGSQAAALSGAQARDALAAWLESFRPLTSGNLWTFHEITYQQNFVQQCEQAGLTRKPNGLRHAFCTYHFALNANENLTAQQAGNSPGMVHSNYKGLATRAEAERWKRYQQTKA